MRVPAMMWGAVVAVAIQSAAVAHPCGDTPTLSDPDLAQRVVRTAERIRRSAAAGRTFADLAALFYGELAEGRPPAEARTIAVALLQASCVAMTRNATPGALPRSVLDKLDGLSGIVPDFHEAKALIARIAADKARR